MSKLYTEEQVNHIANQVRINGFWNSQDFTPIELPTDEEIKMIIKHYHNSLFYLELTEIELENITKIIYKELFGGQE